MNIKTLGQIKKEYYGEVGTAERDRIERELEALRIGFKIRSAREKKAMTQEELATRNALSSQGWRMMVRTLPSKHCLILLNGGLEAS